MVCGWRLPVYGIFDSSLNQGIMLCILLFAKFTPSPNMSAWQSHTHILRYPLEFSSSLPPHPGRTYRHWTYWPPLVIVWFVLQSGSASSVVSWEPDHVFCLSSPKYRSVSDTFIWVSFPATSFFQHGLQTSNLFLLQFSSLILFLNFFIWLVNEFFSVYMNMPIMEFQDTFQNFSITDLW